MSITQPDLVRLLCAPSFTSLEEFELTRVDQRTLTAIGLCFDLGK